jgi:AraC-like DNA-binding protein
MISKNAAVKEVRVSAGSDFILLSILQNAINQLHAMGLPREALLRGTQFASVIALNSKNSTDIIGHRELLTVFANAMALSADPAIGIRYGLRTGIGAYGTLGFAMVSAPTDLHAVSLALKYQRLLVGALIKVSLSIDNSVGVIVMDDAIADISLRRFYLEQLCAGFMAFNTAMAGKPAILRSIELPFPAPDYIEVYREVFDCPVKFDAKRTQIFFDCGVLSTTLPNSDPLTFEACERICEQIMQQFEREKSVTNRIRQFLITRWPELPSMESIARNLGYDVRTLRRHLLDEGSSFRDVKDSVRKNIALEYLQQTQMSIDEIALAVGFSDSATFRRAFRRWTGNYPRFYRQ